MMVPVGVSNHSARKMRSAAYPAKGRIKTRPVLKMSGTSVSQCRRKTWTSVSRRSGPGR